MLKAIVPRPRATILSQGSGEALAEALRVARGRRGPAGARAPRGRRVSRFQERDGVDHEGRDGGALDDRHELPGEEVLEQHSEERGAGDRAHEQHDARPVRSTLGWDSSGTRSVASASPAVCAMCSPAPTIRKAIPAATWPIQAGHWPALPLEMSTSRAKGMDGRASPNWIIDPFQMKERGASRAPSGRCPSGSR